MFYAYEISGDTSYNSVVCDTQDEANTYKAKGWYISDTPVVWATHMYSNGAIVDRPQPTNVLCYFNDGLSYRTVLSTYVAQNGEVIFDHTPTAAELSASFSGYADASKDQQAATIELKYKPEIDNLKDLIVSTIANDGDNQATKLTALQTKYKEVFSKKNAELEAVYNG